MTRQRRTGYESDTLEFKRRDVKEGFVRKFGMTVAIVSVIACQHEATAPQPSASVQALTNQIIAASGRVSIGFKEPGAARGVDATGHVTVSDDTQANARNFLRSEGVVIDFLFVGLPAVVAHMNATTELVARVLANPSIDYLEPVVNGSFSGVR